MDESMRKKHRITPDEEDELGKMAAVAMRNLLEVNLEAKMAGAVSRLLNQPMRGDEQATITYDLDVNPGLIISNLGAIRRKAKETNP